MAYNFRGRVHDREAWQHARRHNTMAVAECLQSYPQAGGRETPLSRNI